MTMDVEGLGLFIMTIGLVTFWLGFLAGILFVTLIKSKQVDEIRPEEKE